MLRHAIRRVKGPVLERTEATGAGESGAGVGEDGECVCVFGGREIHNSVSVCQHPLVIPHTRPSPERTWVHIPF